MAETNLQIAGRHYAIRCRDGEEAHLAHLASLIERKARLAQQNTPGLTEVRTLLFAALFLADELNDLKREAIGRQQSLALDDDDDAAARAIEALAARIEKLSDRLAAPQPDA
ncbi:cell division protein ZapA [Sphingobium sp. Cam5-1]|uniref:cell division protein ZapA n=1 Tax=Sphingobium sp. Cam5-1 TaxID=2789327 RepID=UPI0018AD11EA|nr:cell division protein ZapA [Sphingobium sp. Cam5-1]QPI73486.1 cell division protein ZapA [Sphingobium sp. Cam5-1]